MTNTLPKYENYKASGVEWLGEIPEHWEVKRLRIVADIVNGATPSSSVESYWDGDILWVTPAEINNVFYLNDSIRKISLSGYKSCGTSLVPKGSIILTTRAPIGKVAIAKKELCTNQGCKSIKLKGGNSEYLYFQLLIRKNEVNSLGTGTTFMELGNSELKNLLIVFPPLQEQTAIASFIDQKTAKIDQAIAQKVKLIALLKERRQILIHHAVTKGLDGLNFDENSLNFDLNDGRNTMISKPGQTNQSPSKNHQKSKFRHSGVDWIGEIPEHWEVKRLKYVANQISTKISSKESSFKYIGMENIESWTGKYISSESITEGLASNFKEGDILFGKLRPYLAKVHIAKSEGICSTEFLVFRTESQIYNWYLKTLMLSFGFINLIDSSTYGSKMPRANPEFIGNQFIAIPPKKEQNEISNRIEIIDSKTTKAINLKEKEIEKLKEYKATLINSAVTGKINVSDYA